MTTAGSKRAAAPADFENRLRALDISLYDPIESQSFWEDKSAMLAAQLATRELAGEYTYLEIGSHLGGSIQTHLVDDRCKAIFSIDPRPEAMLYQRTEDAIYPGNSTERMLENLRRIAPPGAMSKLTCIEEDASQVDLAAIDPRPQLCMIDGEHTDRAAYADYQFCRGVLDPAGGAMLFHDSQVIYQALTWIVNELRAGGVRFRAYNLPLIMFVIEFGDFPLHRHPAISEMLTNGHMGYLSSLQFLEGQVREDAAARA